MGEENRNSQEDLLVNLQNCEQHGISILLDGSLCSPQIVENAMSIHEDLIYMGDYIFDEGELSEIRFDTIES